MHDWEVWFCLRPKVKVVIVYIYLYIWKPIQSFDISRSANLCRRRLYGVGQSFSICVVDLFYGANLGVTLTILLLLYLFQ